MTIAVYMLEITSINLYSTFETSPELLDKHSRSGDSLSSTAQDADDPLLYRKHLMLHFKMNPLRKILTYVQHPTPTRRNEFIEGVVIAINAGICSRIPSFMFQ